MISQSILSAVGPRLSESQRILAHIKSLDERASNEKDSLSADNAATLRGLCFVQLYATVEYAVSLSVQVLLQEISKFNVPFSHFQHLMHSVCLDDCFRSLSDPALKTKWPRRTDLLRKQISTEACALNDTVFHDQLQNIWGRTLSNLFEYMCVGSEPVPEKRIAGYVDELVNKRNEVAHGRQSAHEVGRATTTAEIEGRLAAVQQLVNHLAGVFDNYLESRQFIDQAYRDLYPRA